MLIKPNLLLALRTTDAASNQATERLASGKRVSTAADDPLAYARIAQTKASISTAGISLNTLDFGLSRLDGRDGILGTMQDTLMHFKDQALRTTGTTLPSEVRPQMAELQKAMVSLANSKDASGYMFSGTSTTVPFSANAATQAVTYAGSMNDQTISVEGITLTGAMSGSPLMQVFGAMQDVLDTTAAGQQVTAAQMAALESAVDTISGLRTKGAAETGAAENVQSALTSRRDNYQAQVEKLENTDYAEESANLSNSQSQYQATLKVISMELNRKRLMDYL